MFEDLNHPEISNISEAHTLIKQYTSQIKQLNSENQLKCQQIDTLKEKIREFEEFTSIYKKQIHNLESKIKLYDQELNLKLQSHTEKQSKLNQINMSLVNKNQQLQNALNAIDNKAKMLEDELNKKFSEYNELYSKFHQSEQVIDKIKGQLHNKDIEIDRSFKEINNLKGELSKLSKDYHDVKNNLRKSDEDNKQLLKILQDNDIELRKLSNAIKDYKELQSQYEVITFELDYTKTNLETSKKKYEELFYDYNLIVLNREQDKATQEHNISILKSKIEELEKAINDQKGIIALKDKEILALKDNLIDKDNIAKAEILQYDSQLKRILALLDGKCIEVPFESKSLPKTLEIFAENIVKFNQEYLKIYAKSENQMQEIKKLHLSINMMNEELNKKDELSINIRTEKENLLVRLTTLFNDYNKEISDMGSQYEHKYQELAKLLKEKEEENVKLSKMNEAYHQKINRLENQNIQNINIIDQQDRQIKDLKKNLTEEKERVIENAATIEFCLLIIANMIKLILAIHSKIQNLLFQKSILNEGFNQSLQLRQKLNEIENNVCFNTPKFKKNCPLLACFKKYVWVIIAQKRLFKLVGSQINHIRDDNSSNNPNKLHIVEEEPSVLNYFQSLFKTNNNLNIDHVLLNEIRQLVNSNEVNENNNFVEFINLGLKPTKLSCNMVKYKIKPVKYKHNLIDFVEMLIQERYCKEQLEKKLEVLDNTYQSLENFYKGREQLYEKKLEKYNLELNKLHEEYEGIKRVKQDLLIKYLNTKMLLEGLFKTINLKKKAANISNFTKSCDLMEALHNNDAGMRCQTEKDADDDDDDDDDDDNDDNADHEETNIEQGIRFIVKYIEELESKLNQKNTKMTPGKSQFAREKIDLILQSNAAEGFYSVMSTQSTEYTNSTASKKDYIKIPGRIHHLNKRNLYD